MGLRPGHHDRPVGIHPHAVVGQTILEAELTGLGRQFRRPRFDRQQPATEIVHAQRQFALPRLRTGAGHGERRLLAQSDSPRRSAAMLSVTCPATVRNSIAW